MPRVEWLADGSRVYETGVDRGMLYVNGGTGVVWNGLIKVSETSTGGTVREFFLDGDKYLNLPSLEEYAATIEAVSAPKEFAPCEGRLQFYPGAYAANQPRQRFGFSYRTLIGNEVEGLTQDYKLHIIYNVSAKRADIAHQTITQTPNLKTYSWAINAVPEPFIDYKPGSHFVIDTRVTASDVVSAIEDMLYGTDTTDPTLPSVPQLMNALVVSFFAGAVILKKMVISASLKGVAKVTAAPKMKKMKVAAASKGVAKVTAAPKMKKMKVAVAGKGVAKATGAVKMKQWAIAIGAAAPFLKANTLEGGTAAASVTTANSGGASGDAFDLINIGTSHTVTYETAHAMHGTKAMAIAMGATSGTAYAGWGASTTVPKVYGRFYLYQTAYVSGNTRLVACYQVPAVSSGNMFLRFITGTGKFAIIDSASTVVWTSAAAMTLNTWLRFEFMCVGHASAGQLQASYYAGDSVTPIEASPTFTNQNTGGEIATVIFGVSTAFTNLTKLWFDDMAISHLGPLGPSA